MPELWDSLNAAQQPPPAPDMWNAPMGVGSPAETAGAPSGMNSLAAGLYQYLGNLAKRSFGASEEMRQGGAYNPAPAVETALNVMSGGIGGTGEKAGTALTAGYDPKLWHGVSSIKLPKPVSEMESVVRSTAAPETVISPARLQNSLLMPLLGDRTAAAAELARVNGFLFENPVALQGGHAYMSNNPMAWAAGKSIAPGIAGVARAGAETGMPVHGVYTAMGERSADFSHMMSDTLAEMAKHTKITPEGVKAFDDTMRAIAPDFPGINAPNVAEYLRGAPGELRNTFAKKMDTAPMQKAGFPSVAEARVAVTDPRLLNEPTGASGLSIARMDPRGTLGPSGHTTYDTGIAGDYIGGLPASVPKEVMFPDIVGPLSKHADAVAAARDAAGLKPFRPTEDYLMGRVPKGLPKLQEANQQWVDNLSQHLIDRGYTLGSGATDQKTAAAIQGIRAYHSSPHDFDRFDLSKIGTGEGAQVYGHGLYFAENPAVSGQGGQYWQQFLPRFAEPEISAAEVLKRSGFDREQAIANTRKQLADIHEYFGNAATDKVTSANYADRVKNLTDKLNLLVGDKPVGPRTYEVNINADPAHFLDWDKKLPQQSTDVQDALFMHHLDRMSRRKAGEAMDLLENKPGSTIYQNLVRDLGYGDVPHPTGYGNNPAGGASAILNEAGIPGIKYLDQGSRGLNPAGIALIERDLAAARAAGNVDKAGVLERELSKLKPSSNYVVWRPDIIDIMKKYGIAGAAPMAAGFGFPPVGNEQRM